MTNEKIALFRRQNAPNKQIYLLDYALPGAESQTEVKSPPKKKAKKVVGPVKRRKRALPEAGVDDDDEPKKNKK